MPSPKTSSGSDRDLLASGETPETGVRPSTPPDLAPDPHILDYFLLVARHKWMVLLLTFGLGLGAVGISYYLPHTFEAMSLLLPPDRASSAGLLSRFNAGGALKMIKAVENPSVDLLQNILESRAVAKRLAQDSLIHAFYARQTTNSDDLIDLVHEALIVQPGISKVAVKSAITTGWSSDDREKDLAKLVAARLVNESIRIMDSILKNEYKSSAHESMVYAEQELGARLHELDSLDDATAQFQKEHKLYSLKDQTRAAIQQLAQLEAMRAETQLRLRMLTTDLNASSGQATELEAKMQELSRQLGTSSASAAAGLSLTALPAVERDYAELNRRTLTLEPVVAYLRQEVEQQRVNEARERSIIQVLDAAIPPPRKSSPKRLILLLVGLSTGFGFSLVYVGLRSFIDSVTGRPKPSWSERQARKWGEGSYQEQMA